MSDTTEQAMSFADRVRWAIIVLTLVGCPPTIADVAPDGDDR